MGRGVPADSVGPASLMSYQHNKPKAPSSLVCAAASFSSLAPLPPSRHPAPPLRPPDAAHTAPHLHPDARRQSTKAYSALSRNLDTTGTAQLPIEEVAFSALQVTQSAFYRRARGQVGSTPRIVSADITTSGLPRVQI
ncbi:hypothetical protein L226DRAFT_68832 [Lentinus tigrinus ALCF2SS1-7]|uniref:uncharacterized protein n=1 Tax=Lentinus tigrinus ALCF2SS1-7 TaxID=1328758 RepID=UPI001165CAB7|nr:hypothetical protein L226DRAFT_68832 [Lentinus tigrinus ALCF2SS1-7]